ncbi:MAG: type I glyceraldehyde-3-phosphate dehydrogenase [Candidatus Harrisonbacteria bacterium RIFCSPLOWO2_02_FULL_41_11]|uniref:Type I glyceraldehyde-3-phosphate dehydrogenase n=1 Tax=Candidatus Harrisonbacteria bacterium RIFCSPHIGHO2_02_FULL_42_16 TaxID=1798404 RepID=A0A1G1ZFM9_9BACT|nr:MAG: type I glyceraldehyde-3-phosphate dehydrogenase [Candidatus Harrisonbacteria bacterium RIFCSPHIGHO2_02_FULL_42_16]OGY65600.1 MAG: type I glyceraldehyde-3-phosphate dehydrogenase [Candidatus Harrisonbacteria bacterium RIFCSPLOWO2_02_FULL_41_11]
MSARIAINGFGRIGRLFFRAAFKSADQATATVGRAGLDIVAINDLGDIENLAYLLRYDTIYRQFSESVKVKGNELIVGKKRVVVLREKDPAKLPWKKMGIDVAVESTGVFETFEKARAHLVAGAKRVVLTAPAKDEDTKDAKTVLLGVNEEQFKTCKITSNGSCTTNAASPVAAIMAETVGIKKAALNTVHGYTATQNLVDGPTRGKDFRRGRAAAQNISPSSTGATIAVSRALPELEGKFEGVAMRVPVATGSIADFTFLAERKTSVEEINNIFRKAAKDKRWKGILKVTEDQIVSSDIIGELYGAIVDLRITQVIDGDFVKVFSWYDNEAGYVSTLVGHVLKVAENL